ncbi:carboxypeptidase-like regulatory domain-containing protein [Streptomyces yaizuensis]|uniref:Carboxypeptidase-like regulatory domain-containing protein n=1 Tax=Streptomyces yaizuensis TaxID=2989713 RepID=A0ABQ5NSP3_9ACTN|nr:carboxypeptidase-like regulatory domain-containing protein [Streptomyces sp. YSPA8]GLF93387.1 carboxypeptidase-like regulatory domain-containing protein [Streptomyces sp. YSPA8]
MSRFLPLERPALYSPAWFVPYDEHARRVRTAGVGVRLERFADGGWQPLDERAVRTPSAALVYPGLGRRAEPRGVPPERHRARFTAPGCLPLYPADGQPFQASLAGVEFLVHAYGDDRPPAVEAAPRLVRLLPAVSYPYGPGVRTVSGRVVDPVARAPVGNALVEARGRTGDLVAWHERALTDALGAFRLSLRWEGERSAGPEGEVFRLVATERPGRTGSLSVRLPADPANGHVIEIRES